MLFATKAELMAEYLNGRLHAGGVRIFV